MAGLVVATRSYRSHMDRLAAEGIAAFGSVAAGIVVAAAGGTYRMVQRRGMSWFASGPEVVRHQKYSKRRRLVGTWMPQRRHNPGREAQVAGGSGLSSPPWRRLVKGRPSSVSVGRKARRGVSKRIV